MLYADNIHTSKSNKRLTKNIIKIIIMLYGIYIILYILTTNGLSYENY